MLLKVVERCVFERPVHIGPEGLVTNPHGRWVTLTEWTHQRCMETACTTGDLVHTIADLWSVHWPVADAPARLCMFLQAPHLALILSVSQWGWGTLAFQYAQGRRGRGLRCHLAKPLLDGYIDVAVLPPQQGPVAHAPAVMSPDLLLNVADTLRSLVQPREAGQLIPQIHIDSARAHALWLQEVRDNLIRQQLCQTKRCFQMSFLIDCVILSGLVRGSASLRDIVESSVRIAIRDDRLASHFRQQLVVPRAIPSRPHNGTTSGDIAHRFGLTSAAAQCRSRCCRWTNSLGHLGLESSRTF